MSWMLNTCTYQNMYVGSTEIDLHQIFTRYYNFKGLKNRVHGTCVLCVFFYSWYSFVVLANTTCGRRGKKFKFEHSFGKLANAPVLCPGAEQQSLYTLYRHQAFGALPVNSQQSRVRTSKPAFYFDPSIVVDILF